jgi:hypothetical protein
MTMKDISLTNKKDKEFLESELRKTKTFLQEKRYFPVITFSKHLDMKIPEYLKTKLEKEKERDDIDFYGLKTKNSSGCSLPRNHSKDKSPMSNYRNSEYVKTVIGDSQGKPINRHKLISAESDSNCTF